MKKILLVVFVLVLGGAGIAADFQGIVKVNLAGDFLGKPCMNITKPDTTTTWVVFDASIADPKTSLATALTAISLGYDVWVSLNGTLSHAGQNMPKSEAICIIPK